MSAELAIACLAVMGALGLIAFLSTWSVLAGLDADLRRLESIVSRMQTNHRIDKSQ